MTLVRIGQDLIGAIFNRTINKPQVKTSEIWKPDISSAIGYRTGNDAHSGALHAQ